METLSTFERVSRTFEHRPTDRVPILDKPWRGTIKRWQDEGMPKDADWRDYFGVDKYELITADISPHFKEEILEDTDRYTIVRSPFGTVMKNFKELDATPEFLDFKVNTSEAWAVAKTRMVADDERIPWATLEKNYPLWRSDQRWVEAKFWFGFDVTHSWMVGTETLLIALLEEPEWVMDMFDTYLNMCIGVFDKIWDAGYRFDAIYWPDDMGYKNTAFFSNEIYRTMLQPFHKRAVDWAHSKGIYAHLHSCGDIMKLLPDIVETGIDALNPIEIKAGMDIKKLKEDYGSRLVLHGGTNAAIWHDRDAVLQEIDQAVPILCQDGRYIFASDHSIPNSVSADTFRAIVERVKKLTMQ